jgi:hypothetical protein
MLTLFTIYDWVLFGGLAMCFVAYGISFGLVR